MTYITEQQALNIPDGAFVVALYIGDFFCQGTVVSSRCKYGGNKQYTVKLSRDLQVPSRGEVIKAGECISVVHSNILAYTL